MAYIGVQPTDTYLSIASQQITGTGSATYTLDYSVSTEEDVAVFVNNVRQNVSSYTVSSNQLTLGGTISASDSCWILFLGRTVGTKTPAVGSVTNAMLAGSIATSKLADGSTFATTNGITEYDYFRLTTDFTGNVTAITNVERPDTGSFEKIGTGMTESSGIYTFPSTGKYLVTAVGSFYISSSEENSFELYIDVTVNNGGTYHGAALGRIGMNNSYNPRNLGVVVQEFVDVTDTSNVKVKFRVANNSSHVQSNTSTNSNFFYFTFMKLGET